MPADLVNLSPEDQQFEIKKRALIQMSIGTALVHNSSPLLFLLLLFLLLPPSCFNLDFFLS